jgi:hypothetical protein
MLSHFIAQKVEKEKIDYNASIDSYLTIYGEFERDLILSFPLEMVNDLTGNEDDFVYFLSGLENFIRENPTLVDASYNTVEDMIGDMDEFDEGLDNYDDFLDIFNDPDFNDDANDERDVEDFDEDNITQTKFLEEDLIGVWYLESANDKLCIFIDDTLLGNIVDVVTITDVNDRVSNLNLVIEKEDDDIKSLLFNYGFITAEKINIDNYQTDYTFTGIYTKDKLTVQAKKTSTLNECKRKLGL